MFWGFLSIAKRLFQFSFWGERVLEITRASACDSLMWKLSSGNDFGSFWLDWLGQSPVGKLLVFTGQWHLQDNGVSRVLFWLIIFPCCCFFAHFLLSCCIVFILSPHYSPIWLILSFLFYKTWFLSPIKHASKTSTILKTGKSHFFLLILFCLSPLLIFRQKEREKNTFKVRLLIQNNSQGLGRDTFFCNSEF